jgi:phosphate transport system protein
VSTGRAAFEQQLREVQDEVLLLGSMVDRAIERALDALKRRDLELAERVVREDPAINAKRFAIEERCVELIATQQPLARDLRALVAALNVIVDLERMGDHAAGIARIVLRHGDQPLLKPLIDIPRMAELARGMLRGSLDALVARDAELARTVANQDDLVDALHEQVYRELLTYMLADPSTITRAIYLTWVAHNLERIADRVTNICERVVFLVSGQMEEAGAWKAARPAAPGGADG